MTFILGRTAALSAKPLCSGAATEWFIEPPGFWMTREWPMKVPMGNAPLLCAKCAHPMQLEPTVPRVL